jgi:hypothetical protein
MMSGGMMTNPNNAFYIAPQPLTLDEASTVFKEIRAKSAQKTT